MTWWIKKSPETMIGESVREYYADVVEGKTYMVDSVLIGAQITDEDGKRHVVICGDNSSGLATSFGLAHIISRDADQNLHEIGEQDDAS